MTVSSKLLTRLAAAVWLAAGGMLVWRGAAMLLVAREDQGRSTPAILLAAALGLALGAAKGHYVLTKSARRNRRRIEALERPRPWSVFAPGFYPLVGLMIGFGLALRTAAEAGWLGGHITAGSLYVGIGAALLASSLAYFSVDPPPLRTRREEAPEPLTGVRGVLLVNLGTPDAPEPGAVKRYLREFLSDPRVVEVPRLLWRVILECIILPRRSGQAAEAYSLVWMSEGSPLLVYGRRLEAALQETLGSGWRVVLAMRYGRPSIASGLEQLRQAGAEEITLVPLFPQFSNTTTGSVQAEVFRQLAGMRDAPALRVLPPYYDAPGYIDSIAVRVREHLDGQEVDQLVFSYHGLPEEYIKAGDPYLDHCTRTSFALAERLGLEREEWEMAFQSRFGDQPWLQPYLDELVPGLAPDAKRVAVVCPAFCADCLETLEEIGVRLRLDYEAAGGEELIVIPALNDHPRWVRAVAELVRDEEVSSIAEPWRSLSSGKPA